MTVFLEPNPYFLGTISSILCLGRETYVFVRTHINTQTNLTGRPALWFEFLQDYNITSTKHVKGTDNVVADALSQYPNLAYVYQLFSITYLDFTQITVESDTFQQL